MQTRTAPAAPVDAVGFSAQAIERTRERVARTGADVALQCCSIFDAEFTAQAYDLVYDSGFFHHVPPHRRESYTQLVHRTLKPGGSYGLVCFRPEGGSGYTDRQVYERASLGGGLGYSEHHLRAIWDRSPFSVRVLRQMARTGGRGRPSARTSCGRCSPRRKRPPAHGQARPCPDRSRTPQLRDHDFRGPIAPSKS